MFLRDIKDDEFEIESKMIEDHMFTKKRVIPQMEMKFQRALALREEHILEEEDENFEEEEVFNGEFTFAKVVFILGQYGVRTLERMAFGDLMDAAAKLNQDVDNVDELDLRLISSLNNLEQ